MAKKCPKCGKEMTEAGGNEYNPEKQYFCFEDDVWIRVLPNGMQIVGTMGEINDKNR